MRREAAVTPRRRKRRSMPQLSTQQIVGIVLFLALAGIPGLWLAIAILVAGIRAA